MVETCVCWHDRSDHDQRGCNFDAGDDGIFECEQFTASVAPAAAPLSTLPERPQFIETGEPLPMSADLVGHMAEVYALGENDGSPEYVYRRTIQRLCASHETLRSRLSSLEREFDGVRKDAERMDFLERGGFTAFQSSEHKSANVVDCRDNFTKGEGRFYAETIREAIDAAMAYDASLSALRERSE